MMADGGGGCVWVFSPDGGGEGESGEKNSCGDTLPLVKRTADAKTSKNAV